MGEQISGRAVADETQTTNVALGAGSNATFTRAGLLLRWIADNLAAGGLPAWVVSGTFTTSSMTVPADTGRAEVSNYWNDYLIIPKTGVAAYQARAISSFNNTGGVFTLDKPFTTAPGPVGYWLVPNAFAAALTTILSRIGTPGGSLANQVYQVPQPAAYTPTVTIVSGGSNLALGTITIAGIPASATVAHLFIHFLFGERADSSGSTNSLSGAQNLQVKKNAGGFNTFFSFAGGEYSTVASSQAGGDAKKGTVDLVALAPANGDVLTFQFTSAKSVGNNLVLAEFEVIAELWVTP